jgi:hypothetical protein
MPIAFTRLFSAHGAVLAGLLGLSGVAGCSSSTSSNGGADGTSGGTTTPPRCTPDVHCAGELPAGQAIGKGDGSAATVTLTEIYAAGAASKIVDVAWHETRDELWAVGYGDDSIRIGTGFAGDAPSWKRIVDPAAGHFMHKPPALAMGTPDRWATCGDNANEHSTQSDGSAALFMGPALFSTDMAILGKRTSGGLGSHEDMLHNTPLCRGIAWVSANVYWVFNSYDSSLDMYDFHADHGPGMDDHADGEIYRYAMGKVKGVNDGTPSHVFYDSDDKFLYVADTGSSRIVRLDTTKGTKGKPLARQMERIAGNAVMDGTDVEEVVPPGTLTKPSGLEIHGGLLYVTDAETSTFHVFDKTGKEIRHLRTELPAGSLAGLTFAGDGKVYFADRVAGRVMRIDPL